MVELPDGTVLLEKGEAIPFACRCGNLYQPKEGECSQCPACGRVNLHNQQEWQRIGEDAPEDTHD